MARIKKGDIVTVLSGKDKGKTGKVLRIWPERSLALVERLNVLHHFERRSQQHPAGGVVEREGPLPLSKMALVCPRCRRPARVGWRLTGGDPSTRATPPGRGGLAQGSAPRAEPVGLHKQRICRRCQEPL